MRAITVAMASALLLLGLLVGTAWGQTQEQFDQCYEEFEGDPFGPPPTCTFDSQGNLIGSSPSDIGPSGPPGFGGFIAFAIFWSLIPLGIAAAFASSRGESMGMAVGLTLFLGWIGLAIVLFGQKRTLEAASNLANGGARPAYASPPPPPPPPAPPADTDLVSDRLQRLDDLFERGVISADERTTRRQRILDQI